MSPAFTVLGVNPETVTRPTTAREFGTSLLNGVDQHGNLQTGLALDFVPFLTFFGDQTSLSSYRQNRTERFLARSQLSFATTKGVTDEDKATRLGLGLRLTLWDKGDPRLDGDLDICYAGAVNDRPALARAAVLVAEGQQADGSWQVEGQADVGSPATYGACLATYQARRVLQRADPERYRTAVARAADWLRQVRVQTLPDAAAVLLALAGDESSEAVAQRGRCLGLVRKGESKEGGWGPYAKSAPEPFDTAVVLLALARYPDEPDAPAMVRRGRAYLIAAQRADGSWPETTRPAGAESYAQRLSTAGWATLALLAGQRAN